jgi:hypothetical protein
MVGNVSTEMKLTLLYVYSRIKIKDSTLCEQQFIFIPSFRRVLHVVCNLLGCFPACGV